MVDPVRTNQGYVAGVIPLPLSQKAEISLLALSVILMAGAIYAAYRSTTTYSLGLTYKCFTATAMVLLVSALYIAIRSDNRRHEMKQDMRNLDPPNEVDIDETEIRRLAVIAKAKRRIAQSKKALVKRNLELLDKIKSLPLPPPKSPTCQEVEKIETDDPHSSIHTFSDIQNNEENFLELLAQELEKWKSSNGREPTLYLTLKQPIDLPKAKECLDIAAQQDGQAVINELYDILDRNLDRYSKNEIVELFAHARAVCTFDEGQSLALELWKKIALIGIEGGGYWQWACAFKESVIELAEYQSKPICEQIFHSCNYALEKRITAIEEENNKQTLLFYHLELLDPNVASRLKSSHRAAAISLIKSGESLYLLD